MKKHYFLTLLLALCFGAFYSCGSDDSYTEIPQPQPQPQPEQESPVVMDINAVPYVKLSDYNFYEGDLKNMQPVYGVLPYDLNSALFTDYASKKRFVWMPKGVKATYSSDDKILDFPVGTVLIKNFYYEKMKPSNTQRIIETRLMIKKESGWIFANYVWNDEQTEAELNLNGSYTDITWDQEGTEMTTSYRIPGEIECATCHKLDNKNIPIGVKPQNLNKIYTYSDGAKNQLSKWIEAGYLTNNLPSNIVSTVNWKDESLSLDLRARSYLDINCAHCHSPGTSCGYAPMDLSFSKTTDPVNLGVCVEPQDFVQGDYPYLISAGAPRRSLIYFRMKATDPSDMMPRIGRTVVDTKAIDLMWDWIGAMPQPCE